MNDENLIKRLEDVFLTLQHQKVIKNKADFASKLNYNRSHISEMLSNRKIITDAFKYALVSTFHVDKVWLETGKGYMFGEPDQSNSGDYTKSPFNIAKKKPGTGLIPFYEVDFMAGNSVEFYEDTITPAYYMDIPEFRGCTAFRAYSDSMEKIITSGNILFGAKLEDWESHLEYGQIYGITMNDNRRYLKYIRRFKETQKITFCSEVKTTVTMNLKYLKIKLRTYGS